MVEYIKSISSEYQLSVYLNLPSFWRSGFHLVGVICICVLWMPKPLQNFPNIEFFFSACRSCKRLLGYDPSLQECDSCQCVPDSKELTRFSARQRGISSHQGIESFHTHKDKLKKFKTCCLQGTF